MVAHLGHLTESERAQLELSISSLKMESEHVWRMALLIMIVLFANIGHCKSENTCIGSGCFCTAYPVTVKCINAFIDYVPEHIKQVATEVEIIGSSMRVLANMDLSEWLSVKSLRLSINSNGVCQWIAQQLMDYARIKISSLVKDCVIDKETSGGKKDSIATKTRKEIIASKTSDQREITTMDTLEYTRYGGNMDKMSMSSTVVPKFEMTSVSTVEKIELKTRKKLPIIKMFTRTTPGAIYSTITDMNDGDNITSNDGLGIHVAITGSGVNIVMSYAVPTALLAIGSSLAAIG